MTELPAPRDDGRPALLRAAARHPRAAALAATLAFEAVTLVARFGLGLEATRDTASTVGLLTGGLRIHHGYAGLLLLALLRVAPLARRDETPLLRAIGIGLLASDLLHHFVVLYLATGSPQFDLFYPPARV